MKLPLVLDQIVNSVGEALKKTRSVVWIVDEPTNADLDYVKAQTNTSRFDPHHLRASVFEDLLQGKAQLVCKRGVVGLSTMKVLALVYPGLTRIDWDLWGDIFRAFQGESKKKYAWRVVFFAHPMPRSMPDQIGSEPGPGHVNGGYAFPGDPSSIVIYREEEAPRVLLHEMLHAVGSDDMRNTETIREVLTETWAELFLIAVRAAGSKKKAVQLWAVQAQWIRNQESSLTQNHNVQGPQNYSWRYTVGRSAALAGLGIRLPRVTQEGQNTSLSFTDPSLTAGSKGNLS